MPAKRVTRTTAPAAPADAPAARANKKSTPSAQAWLIIGGDEYQREIQARGLIDKCLPPPAADMALETLDGAADTVAAAVILLRKIIDALCAGSLFNERRVLWVRNASFLDDGIIARGKDVTPLARELAGLIAGGLPPEQFLIITAGAVPAKSPLTAACTLMEQEAPKPWQRQSQAEAFAAQALKQAGLQAGGDVVKKLVARVGHDSRQLHQEITKLAIYLGARKNVTAADVTDIVSAGRECFVWDFEDAVAGGLLTGALEIQRRLLFQKEEPLRLINALETKYRHMLAFREAINEGWMRPSANKFGGGGGIPPQMQEIFAADRRLMNPVARNNLLNQAARFTLPDLLRANRLIMQARLRVVNSDVPQPLILEDLVIRLCRLGRPPRKNI